MNDEDRKAEAALFQLSEKDREAIRQMHTFPELQQPEVQMPDLSPRAVKRLQTACVLYLVLVVVAAIALKGWVVLLVMGVGGVVAFARRWTQDSLGLFKDRAYSIPNPRKRVAVLVTFSVVGLAVGLFFKQVLEAIKSF